MFGCTMDDLTWNYKDLKWIWHLKETPDPFVCTTSRKYTLDRHFRQLHLNIKHQ